MRRTLGDDLVGFCDTVGIRLFDWQREAFGEACRREHGRFVHRLAGISVARGNGKSWGAAAVGLWRLVTQPGCTVLSVALDYEGAKVILAHAKTMVRGSEKLAAVIDEKETQLSVPETGSRWLIRSSDHLSSRGLHPDIVILDEAGWAQSDDLFTSLLASQASARDPLALVVSTVGRRQSGPLWSVKQAAEAEDGETYWFHRSDNPSPLVTESFLARAKRLLLPSVYSREHCNVWVDAADSYVTAAEVDRAMASGRTQQEGTSGAQTYHVAVDLGLVSDPTVVSVGHAEGNTVVLDHVVMLQGTRKEPVQLAAVEQVIRSLCTRFRVVKVEVESWQGAATAQRLAAAGLPVTIVTPTPKLLQEQWSALASRFANGTVELFPHPRLREELLGLVVEVTASGPRVVDRGRAHQDVSTTVRMLAASLGQAGTFSGFIALDPMPRAGAWSPTAEIVVGEDGIDEWDRRFLQLDRLDRF